MCGGGVGGRHLARYCRKVVPLRVHGSDSGGGCGAAGVAALLRRLPQPRDVAAQQSR